MINEPQGHLFSKTEREGQNGPSDCTTSNHPARGTDGAGKAVCARRGCSTRFSPYRPYQEFCSRECQREEWAEKHPRRGTAEESRALAKQARDEGMTSAARHYQEEIETARRVALDVLGAIGAGTISHVRAECEDRELELDWAANWPGSLFHASPWFEPTGRRLTTFHASSNARKVNEYQLTYEGRRALGEMNHFQRSQENECGTTIL